MKQVLLTFFVVIATLFNCHAQKIELRKKFGSYQFYQSGKRITPKKAQEAMEPNPRAYIIMKQARNNNAAAATFGAIGGGFIGYAIGTFLSTEEFNWGQAGLGAGIVVIGIPFSIAATRKSEQAVEIFNSSLNSSTFYRPKRELNLTLLEILMRLHHYKLIL